MAQSPSDSSPDEGPLPGDLETARLFDQRIAETALLKPADKTEFEYGRVAGLYQGLTMAIEALQDVLADREDDE
jgi:hypothetical protein